MTCLLDDWRGLTTAFAAALLMGGCGPEGGSSTDSGSGGSTTAATTDSATSTTTDGSTGSTTAGSGSTGEATDPELEAVANLRATLEAGSECNDLRKTGTTKGAEPGIVVVVEIPSQNQAEPGEEVAERTYTLPDDAQLLQMQAFVGVEAAAEQPCKELPDMGTVFDVVEGTIHVTYEVVDNGCIFSCERLFVDAEGLVFERQEDGATVAVERLYLPPWTDPSPPDG